MGVKCLLEIPTISPGGESGTLAESGGLTALSPESKERILGLMGNGSKFSNSSGCAMLVLKNILLEARVSARKKAL